MVFDQLRGKKRVTVRKVVTMLMQRTGLRTEVAEEIGDMVYEDLELRTTSQEFQIKMQIIRSIFNIIESLCKRFGEVHLEQRQDDYAVLRVIFNEQCC